jgi:pimeloyl-ACP methyl ester carboxylesterase
MAAADWRPGPRVAGADGVEIATWDLGGSGPPLLLLHATGFHARMWLPLAPVLRASHRVWAVDQRGHGASGHAADRTYRDWSRFVADLLAVVDRLGLADDGLRAAGHSLGGAVLLLAEQHRPGLLRAAYCYEPVVPAPAYRSAGSGEASLARVTAKRRAGFASRAEARANYAAKAPFASFAPEALDAYVAHAFVDRPDGTVELACTPAEEATVYEGAMGHRAWEHLGEVAAPVVVAGGSDTGGLAATIPALVDALPRGRIEHWDRLSHFGPMEDPPAVAAAIVAALTDTGDGAGSTSAVTPGR